MEKLEQTPMSDKVKERIEKSAREYCQGSPHYLFELRGYFAGANEEHPKAWNEAIDECRYEVALWLTEPEKLGSALMDKLEKLKHKQP